MNPRGLKNWNILALASQSRFKESFKFIEFPLTCLSADVGMHSNERKWNNVQPHNGMQEI